MKNSVSIMLLLILQLSHMLLAIQLNGQTGETSHRPASGKGAWPPAIPMWSFLPDESRMGGEKKVKSLHVDERNGHPNQVPSLHPDDILAEAEDISSLLSPRRLNPLKRSSSSISYSLADSIRTTEDLKRSRPYDVPQIECPLADDGMERFACPTPDTVGRYRCVDDHVLCDGFIDCPNAEDENRQACMFYKTTKAHLDVLADALLRWARGRR